MSRKFIVTADDYGVSPIIDRAVSKAVGLGIVTSVACFANGTDKNNKPSMKSIIDLKKKHPGVEIGCHFTITSGNRMSKMDSDLGKKGKPRKFRKRGSQHPSRASVTNGMDELVDELTAQVEAFANAGLEIEHFSDHMGILSYTRRGMKAMLEVIANYNMGRIKKAPMRNPVFISCVKKLDGTCLDKSTMARRGALGAAFKALIQRNNWEDIKLKRKRLNRQLKMVHRKGIRSTDYLIESYYGNASKARLKCIQRKALNSRYEFSNPISTTDITSEIMVHLAVAPGDGISKSDYKKHVKALRKHGGVAVNYLKKKRIEEFETLKKHFSNSFPTSELGGFNH